MTAKKSSFMPQNRRGLSSVVGALFFTVLMIAGFTVLSLALDAQTDIVTTQRIISDVEIKKQQEDYKILPSTDASNSLSISVNNRGQNPVEISSIWITNKTLSDQPVKRYDVSYDNAFIPSGLASNIISSQDLKLISDTYDIKVISRLGSIETAEFTVGSGSGSDLRAELITDPPDVIIGQNVTVAMLVTNTGPDMIYNVQPSSLDVTGSGIVSSSSSHTPPFVDLNGGASVMFSWDYKVTGNSGDQLIFTGNATGNGDAQTSQVSDISILREPTDGGSGSIINILSDELLARPQLFLTIPAPFGDDSDDAGLWGVNVVNPVNATMKVSKITILLTGPGITGNGNLFDCAAIFSVVEGPDRWSCPNPDTLMWEDTSSPVSIPPYSVQSFSVRVTPDQHTGQPSSMEALNVQANVFTTSGAFGKSGYQTTMHTATMAISNVYLSTVVDSIDPLHMRTSRSNIGSGDTEIFNIVFAELESNTSTYINKGQLIINVPKEWTNVSVINNPTSGFVNPAIVTPFGDGSHQIVATLPTCAGSTCMGGNVGNPSNTIQISAKAPDVTVDHMYVMYVLATGEATKGPDQFSVGNLSEIVLQVVAP